MSIRIGRLTKRQKRSKPCEMCGTIDNVKFEVDPYLLAICADLTKRHLCEDCRSQCAEEV